MGWLARESTDSTCVSRFQTEMIQIVLHEGRRMKSSGSQPRFHFQPWARRWAWFSKFWFFKLCCWTFVEAKRNISKPCLWKITSASVIGCFRRCGGNSFRPKIWCCCWSYFSKWQDARESTSKFNFHYGITAFKITVRLCLISQMRNWNKFQSSLMFCNRFSCPCRRLFKRRLKTRR